jgi:hypothetical protein
MRKEIGINYFDILSNRSSLGLQNSLFVFTEDINEVNTINLDIELLTRDADTP